MNLEDNGKVAVEDVRRKKGNKKSKTPSKWQRKMSRLRAGKRYLSTDFKLHISSETPCADHCSVYALSSHEAEYRETCSHQHSIGCDQCSDLRDAIMDIQQQGERGGTRAWPPIGHTKTWRMEVAHCATCSPRCCKDRCSRCPFTKQRVINYGLGYEALTNRLQRDTAQLVWQKRKVLAHYCCH